MSDPARILVVDDTAHNVKLLADILGARGYAVRPTSCSSMSSCPR